MKKIALLSALIAFSILLQAQTVPKTLHSNTNNVVVTFLVNMQNETVSPNGVYMKGNWDDWTDGVKMEITSGSIYSATIPVLKNFSLNYKFYNGDPNGTWFEMKGEDFLGDCTDEWTNRIFNVEESDTVLEKVCFESCTICQSTNPAQLLSKGVGFSQAFEVFSPYDIQFNYYTIEDFQNVKKLGLNSIRLPIFMDKMFEENSDEMSPLFFYLLDQYVDIAESEGLNLILTNMSGFDYANDPAIQDKFINIWTQMAEHYKNRSTKIFYELANEPNSISDEVWGQIQGNVIDAIREIDQIHTIVVTPIWDGLDNLKNLPFYEDDNLIYAFHFYDPFLYTHQGVVNASLSELVGVPFPYNESEMPAMPASFIGNWYEGLYYDYKTAATAEGIRTLINTAAKFKNERNVPVWCGEFGVVGGTDPDDRAYWYNALRSSLDENGIPWSMHGYTRYSGPFEDGTYHLFDHDLDIHIVEALGLIVSPQTDFVVNPETAGSDIYKDYPEPYIFPWISSDEGTTHLFSEEDPYEGKFCIYTEDLPIWNAIDFRFEPHRDLSELVANGYILEFMVKGDTPGAKFNVRFMDTDTSDPNDHPWRIVHDIDETMADWDGEWLLIQIPLSDFVEQGTFEDEWHDPEGKFDWKAIGNFQITTEFHSFEGMKFWFDNIRIVEGQQNDSVNVTFQVDMQNEVVSSSGVRLNGSFCNWTPANAVELTAVGSVYSATMQLKKGETIEYKFVNGVANQWTEYETINGLSCEFGYDANRGFVVPDEDFVLDPVCFNSCKICEPVVSDSVNVTFRVDMQNETVSDKGVHIGGSFESFGELDANGSVYSTTIKLKKGETLSYKFINGELYDWVKYEIITGNCTSGDAGDRWLLVPNNDVTLDVACFGSCGECEPVVVSDSVSVTFRVDMQNETVSATGVNLMGSFSNWTEAKPMQLFSGGIVYAATLRLKKGETIEYKFVNGGTTEWDKYEILTGQPCAFGNDANRGLVVPNNDVTLDVVCFGGCDKCKPDVISDLKDMNIFLFPNPTSGKIEIKGISETEKYEIVLISEVGQELKQITSSGEKSIRLDLTNLPKGLYIISIKNMAVNQYFKIVKN